MRPILVIFHILGKIRDGPPGPPLLSHYPSLLVPCGWSSINPFVGIYGRWAARGSYVWLDQVTLHSSATINTGIVGAKFLQLSPTNAEGAKAESCTA